MAELIREVVVDASPATITLVPALDASGAAQAAARGAEPEAEAEAERPPKVPGGHVSSSAQQKRVASSAAEDMSTATQTRAVPSAASVARARREKL